MAHDLKHTWAFPMWLAHDLKTRGPFLCAVGMCVSHQSSGWWYVYVSSIQLMVHLNTTDGSSLKGALYHVHEGSMLTPSTPCSALGYHYNPTK